jgi:hypothetical protein
MALSHARFDCRLVGATIHALISGKGKLVTTGQYAEINDVAYTTVMHWLQAGKVECSVRHETPFGHYWELPDDAPRPNKLSGRPKKETSAKKSTKKGAK